LAVSLSLDLDAKRFLRDVISKGPEKFQTQLVRAFRSIGAAFVSRQKRERLRGGPGPGKLGVRGGALMRSVGFTLKDAGEIEDTEVVMGYGPPAQAFAANEVEIYANVHANPGGTTITPVNGQYLAIPIADNLTGKNHAGKARVDSPRDLGDPRFVPWQGDTYLVFDGNQLMFKLQRSVFVEQRLDVPADWEAFRPVVMDKLRNAIGKTAKGFSS